MQPNRSYRRVADNRGDIVLRRMEKQSTSKAPSSEEYLRAHTVGEPEPLSGPIILVDCDPRWPEIFQNEAERIRSALGPRALHIEHVGSTSVPDLPAKPIVDIVLVVADSADEMGYAGHWREPLINYVLANPNSYQYRMFKGPQNRVNLHVFSEGCPEVDRMLAFRNWLRANQSDRELYARTKRALAQQGWRHAQNYADAKTAVIEEIMTRAELGVSPDAPERKC
jgi:GrpB-like predicted nucleotidyltransferase (UPF0157 family)